MNIQSHHEINHSGFFSSCVTRDSALKNGHRPIRIPALLRISIIIDQFVGNPSPGFLAVERLDLCKAFQTQ